MLGKGKALLLVVGLLPVGAVASTGFAPQAARPTSGGGWVDRSGYSELIYHSVAEGTYVGVEVGFALTDINDPGSANRILLGGVIGSAVGLAIPLLLTNQGEVRTGDVVFMGVAHTLGMANGFLVPFTVQLALCTSAAGSGCPLLLDSLSTTARIDFGISAAVSLGAGAATLLVNQQLNLSPGQAEGIGAAALWGAAFGFLAAVGVPDALINTPALFFGLIIGGADAGALAGFLMRDFFDIDRGRIWFMNTGVGVGIGAGLALAYFISPSTFNYTAVSIAGIAGGIAGCAVAYFATGQLDGFKQNAPSDRPAAAAARLDAPSIRPLASLARGERASGIQVDLIQGRF